MQPLYNVNHVITCNNTTGTCESHASLTVLVKNNFSSLIKAIFHRISLFRSILQTCAFWVPILLARVPIWSPFHWNLGPHRVPILKKVGPHANWEQWSPEREVLWTQLTPLKSPCPSSPRAKGFPPPAPLAFTPLKIQEGFETVVTQLDWHKILKSAVANRTLQTCG